MGVGVFASLLASHTPDGMRATNVCACPYVCIRTLASLACVLSRALCTYTAQSVMRNWLSKDGYVRVLAPTRLVVDACLSGLEFSERHDGEVVMVRTDSARS